MAKIFDLMRELADRARYLIFVPRCASCRKHVEPDEFGKHTPFCRECHEKWLTEISRPCPKCGRPIGECICGIPADKNLRIDSEIHLATYNIPGGSAKGIVLTAKKRNFRHIFDFLINSMSELIQNNFDINEKTVLTYVPRNPGKYRRIGHDQSRIIACGVSEKTGVPLIEFIRHSKGGKQQKTLDFSERRRNARLSYELNEKNKKYIRGREIILFDDTITTGWTMVRCASLLKQAGASKVYALSITKNV
ncbi:MAG: ComF family protein [Clostridia bacterium]|nr:ComF family protein [Clostridia bacterium]